MSQQLHQRMSQGRSWKRLKGASGGREVSFLFLFLFFCDLPAQTGDRQREFAMAAASVGDSVGIALAGLAAFPVHRYFCSLWPCPHRDEQVNKQDVGAIPSEISSFLKSQSELLFNHLTKQTKNDSFFIYIYDNFTFCEQCRFITGEHWTVLLTLVYDDFILTTSIFNRYDLCPMMTKHFVFSKSWYFPQISTTSVKIAQVPIINSSNFSSRSKIKLHCENNLLVFRLK